MAETILETFAVQFLFKGDRRDLDRWEQGFKKVNMQLNSVARTAAVAGGALTAALFGVGRTILGFEQTMNNLQAILNASSEEMEKLREQALEFGSATAFSASQVGEAQTELAQGFGDVERTLKALPDVLNLASAGQLSMGEAAALVRNQMNAFGLTIDDVSHITDVLAKAATSGSTTVRQLAPAFAQVAAGANTAGLSIERTAAFIVALRDVGLRAEQAGTALRNVIVRLTEPEPPQNFLNALNSIGVSFEELKRLAQRGEYEDIFRRLGEAGLDAATAISLFGTEGFSAGASLTDSISKVEALTESLIGAEGWAERMRLIQEQGLPGAVAAFRSALEGLQLSLGEAGLTGWIAKAADTLRGFVVWLRNADGWVKTTMAIVLASGPVLLGLAAFLKLVSFAISGLVPLLKIAAWANTKFGISAKFAAFWNSNFILSLRLAAINVRAYIASQILATLWNSNFVVSLRLAAISVTGFAVRLWTSGTAALGRFATSVRTNAIPALSRFAATIWTSTIGALRGLVTNLRRASLGMLRFALKAIVAGISGVIAFGVALWASMIPPLIAATAAVTAFTVALLANPVVLVITAVIGAFVALGFVIYKFRRQIVGALKTALAWIKGNWPLLVGILLGPFGIVGALVWKFRDQILGAFRDVWDWLRESPIFSPVIDGIQAIIDFVSELPGRVVGILKDIPGMIADAIRDVPGLGVALEAFTGIAGKVGKALGLAEGGIVPGPLGRPLLATVHGGEMVLPTGLSQMLKGFQLGPAALPQAPPGYGQMYRSSVTNRTVIINMNEPIVIQTQATDAKGIAQEIGEAIQDQIRNVAYDHDGPVER